MKSDIIVAVDLGTTKIVMASAIKEKDGRLNVLGFDSKTINRGVVRNGIVVKPTDAAGAIQELYKLMNNRLADQKIKVNSTYVSVSGRGMRNVELTESLSFDKPTEVSERIVEMLREQASKTRLDNKSVYELLDSEYVLDGVKTDNPIGSICTSISVRYSAIIGDPIIGQNIAKMMNRTPLAEEDSLFAPLCVARAVLNASDRENGCVAIDFGSSTTSFAIYHHNKMLSSAVIPFGAQHITSDIAKTLSLRETDAEELKLTKGVAMAELAPQTEGYRISGYDRDSVKATELSEIIQARLDEILSILWQEIRRIGLENELKAGVVITGGGSKLSHIENLIQQRFAMPTRRGVFSNLLMPDVYARLQATEYAQIVEQLLLGAVSCAIQKEEPKNNDVMPKTEDKKKSKENIFQIPFGDIFNTT